ncbi:hypothetical protein [Paramagnetospirillum marisnigri]|uniref:hypothetical protein n=1 Tax=Paramagnetospirillum marisnigri TaxID=1285242 RepID=UPI000AAD7CE1|nr:hypothetical protein [Paramagnetospirillum marisnigri]
MTKKYIVSGNGSSVDCLVCDLVNAFDGILNVEISGLFTPHKKPDHKSFKLMEEQPPLSANNTRRYFIRLSINTKIWEMTEILDKTKLDGLTGDAVVDQIKLMYAQASNVAREKLKDFLSAQNGRFGVYVSAGSAVYITIACELPITFLDFFAHCGTPVSDYVKIMLSDFIKFCESKYGNAILDKLYDDLSFRNAFLREAENKFRLSRGAKKVGDAWVNETALYELLKNHFDDIVREYSPEWAGRYRYDYFIPSYAVAIEYHGEQHFKPIEIFGGHDALAKTKERDIQKKDLARKNRVHLIEWLHSTPITEDSVAILVREIRRRKRRA